VRAFGTFLIVVAITVIKLPELDSENEWLRICVIWVAGLVFSTQILTRRTSLDRSSNLKKDLGILLSLSVLIVLAAGIMRVQYGLTQLRLPQDYAPATFRPGLYSWYSHDFPLLKLTGSDLRLTRVDQSRIQIDTVNGQLMSTQILLDDSRRGLYTDGSLLRFSPDRKRLVIAFGTWIGAYDVAQETVAPPSLRLTCVFTHELAYNDGGALVRNVDIMSDNRTVVALNGQQLCLLDIDSGHTDASTQVGVADADGIAVSPDDRLLAERNAFGAALFTLPSLTFVRRISWVAPSGQELAFSADGKYLISPLSGAGWEVYVVPIQTSHWIAWLAVSAFVLLSSRAAAGSLIIRRKPSSTRIGT
jgi:hypothetical protein